MDYSLDYYLQLQKKNKLKRNIEKLCCDILIHDYEDTKGNREDVVLDKKLKALKSKRRYIEMEEDL